MLVVGCLLQFVFGDRCLLFVVVFVCCLMCFVCRVLFARCALYFEYYLVFVVWSGLCSIVVCVLWFVMCVL